MRGRLLSRLLLASAMLLPASLSAGADDSIEYAVKAAYLTKFIPFIDWPDTALASQPGFTICVVGPDPFGAALDRAVAGQKIGDKPLGVRRMAALDSAASCPILFLGGTDEAAAAGALESLKDKPVVTVTDSGLHAHGVISFVLADNHVRFDIDDQAAARSGVKISSKLLELAHAVKRREGTP
jgi:hypothetical protein